jgi:hypothetical protein
LAILARRLPPAAAADTVGPTAQAVAEQMTTGTAPDDLSRLAGTLSSLAGQLTTAHAAALARTMADRMAAEKNTRALEVLAGVLAALAERVGPAAADVVGPVARALADRVTAEEDPLGRGHLADALSALTGRLNLADAGAVGRAVADRMTAERDHRALGALARALAALAGRAGPAAAADVVGPVARALADRTVAEQNPYTLGDLAGVLAVLTGQLDRVAAADMVGPVSRAVAERLTVEKDPDALQSLQRTLLTLADALRDEELLGLLKSHGVLHSVRTVALSEFGRRSGRTQALAAAAGVPPAYATGTPVFGSVWEFVSWAEQHRSGLDFKSRPAYPALPVAWGFRKGRDTLTPTLIGD